VGSLGPLYLRCFEVVVASKDCHNLTGGVASVKRQKEVEDLLPSRRFDGLIHTTDVDAVSHE